MANGQNSDYSEKRKWPKASSAPALGLNTIILKYVYWYMKQISGERLQDHWSSGYLCSEDHSTALLKNASFIMMAAWHKFTEMFKIISNTYMEENSQFSIEAMPKTTESISVQ